MISHRNYLAISGDASKGANLRESLHRVVKVGTQGGDIFCLKTKKIASKDELDTGRDELPRFTQLEEREGIRYMNNVGTIFSKDN